MAIIICLWLHIFGKEYLINKNLSESWLIFLLAPTIISMLYIGRIMLTLSKKDEQYFKINTDFDYADRIIENILQNQNAVLDEILFLRQENLVSEEAFQNKIHIYLNSEQSTSYNDLITLIELKHNLRVSDETLFFKKKSFLNSTEYVSKKRLEYIAQHIKFDLSEFNFKLRRSRIFLLKSSSIRLIKLSITLLSMILYILLRLNSHQ